MDGMTVGDVPEFRDIDDVDSVYCLISDQVAVTARRYNGVRKDP
jgi:hypothetical protein